MLDGEIRREKRMLEITASEITRASTTHVKREKICSALVELVMLVVLQHRGNTQHDTTTADCTCKHNSCDDTVVFIFFSALVYNRRNVYPKPKVLSRNLDDCLSKMLHVRLD